MNTKNIGRRQQHIIIIDDCAIGQNRGGALNHLTRFIVNVPERDSAKSGNGATNGMCLVCTTILLKRQAFLFFTMIFFFVCCCCVLTWKHT